MDNQHEIEPELKQVLPRKIKNKGGFMGVVRPFFWLLMPHTWIALLSPIFFVWLFLGHYNPEVKTDGTVVRHYTAYNRRGEQTHRVIYRYKVRGRDYWNDERVAPDVYDQFEKGKTAIKVEANHNLLERGYDAHIVLETDNNFPYIFGALWCAIWYVAVSATAWGMCGPFLRSQYLVRAGYAVAGTVTDLKIKTGRRQGDRFPTISYTYDAQHVENGVPKSLSCGSEMPVSQAQYDQTHVGDTVTILYDAKKPKYSIVYKYADHVACT